MDNHFDIRKPHCAVHIVLLILTFMALVTGCASLKKGAGELVEIEYDHRLTFGEYNFGTELPYGGGGGATYIDANGVWLIYHICSIRNEKPNAQTFHFDLSKFYVVHNGKEYHAKQFWYDDLVYPPLGAADFPIFYQKFREAVFTAPDSAIIPENTSAYLSISWRFAVLVRGPVDPAFLSPELRYDNSGGESLLLLTRGWLPAVLNDASEANLAATCRPKK